ncbi:hypothetical protein Tco_0759155 [Tanacetum coccineum]
MIKMYKKHVLNNVKKGTGQREVRPVWTNAMRVNHQNFSNSRRNFAPTSVLTKSGLVLFSTARQSFSRTTTPVSAARSFNTAIPSVNVAKPRTNAFQKLHSLLRRPFYQQIALKNRNLNNKVNTAKIQALLRRLDRHDLSQLYSLVLERFKDHPLKGHDLDLWGALRMIFDPNEEDDICTSIQINMLVEKKYPLKKEILEKMINLKIEAEEESTMAHELIKLIKS